MLSLVKSLADVYVAIIMFLTQPRLCALKISRYGLTYAHGLVLQYRPPGFAITDSFMSVLTGMGGMSSKAAIASMDIVGDSAYTRFQCLEFDIITLDQVPYRTYFTMTVHHRHGREVCSWGYDHYFRCTTDHPFWVLKFTSEAEFNRLAPRLTFLAPTKVEFLDSDSHRMMGTTVQETTSQTHGVTVT